MFRKCSLMTSMIRVLCRLNWTESVSLSLPFALILLNLIPRSLLFMRVSAVNQLSAVDTFFALDRWFCIWIWIERPHPVNQNRVVKNYGDRKVRVNLTDRLSGLCNLHIIIISQCYVMFGGDRGSNRKKLVNELQKRWRLMICMIHLFAFCLSVPRCPLILKGQWKDRPVAGQFIRPTNHPWPSIHSLAEWWALWWFWSSEEE